MLISTPLLDYLLQYYIYTACEVGEQNSKYKF